MKLYIDQSKQKMFQKCPRQYEFRYVKNLILPPNGSVFFGATMHHSLAFLGRYKMEHEMALMPESVLLDHFSTAFDRKEAYLEEEAKKAIELPDIDWRGDDKGQTKDTGIELLRLYYRSRAPQIMPMQVEAKFERVIPGTEDIYYGTIDRTDLSGYTIDYKTAGQTYGLTYSKASVEADIQPTAYAFALGGPIKFGWELFLKLNYPKLEWRETDRTQNDINWYIEMLKMDIQQIKAGLFPPRPNNLCKEWCGYRNLCGFRV